MAYFRTLKDGETRLIYTAKDRRIQESRRALVYGGPIPHITAVRDYGNIFARHAWKRQDVEHFWWWNDYNPATMQAAIDQQRAQVRDIQRRILLSLKRERERISGARAWSGQETITIAGETRAVEAIPGYVAYDRLTLAYHQDRLREMEMARGIFTDPARAGKLHLLGGHAFRAPYAR